MLRGGTAEKMSRGEMDKKMTIKRNVKSVKRIITSGIALVLLISVCSACIWGAVSVAKNGIATSDTATWGIGTDGLATNGLATNGIATGGVGVATYGVATEGNSTGYDIYAPLKNVLVATGEVTWEEINRKEQLPGMSLEFYVENGWEISEELLQTTPEYLDGRLDYLDKEKVAYSTQGIEDTYVETVAEAEQEAVARVSSEGYIDVSLYSTEEKYLMATNNYSQETLTDAYNMKNGTNYTGTCSEIAATIVIEYYYRKGYGGTLGDENRQDIFSRVLKEAIECGAFPAENNSGTYRNKLKNAISGYYDYYGVDLDGNHDTLLLKNKIQNSLSTYKPVIGDFEAPNGDNHSMCICGYYDITVRYKTSSGASYSYKTYRYYRVNNGYENAYSRYDSQTDRRLQYIYEEYLYSITRIV